MAGCQLAADLLWNQHFIMINMNNNRLLISQRSIFSSQVWYYIITFIVTGIVFQKKDYSKGTCFHNFNPYISPTHRTEASRGFHWGDTVSLLWYREIITWPISIFFNIKLFLFNGVVSLHLTGLATECSFYPFVMVEIYFLVLCFSLSKKNIAASSFTKWYNPQIHVPTKTQLYC